MSFRLVSSGGTTVNPTVVSMAASGTIHPGGVVTFIKSADLSDGYLATALSTSTQTQIFGVALDYKEGKSDAFVNVIPFAPGQVWEGDCINTVSTLQIGKRFSLSTATTPERSRLLNNNSYDQSGMTGIFLVWNVTSLSTGSGKLIGEFIRNPGSTPSGLTAFT